MFMHENCHQLFYTNDVYVLIDIIVRQLSGRFESFTMLNIQLIG